MAIYAISDLHLSFSTPGKPMDVFGDKWENHAEKIREDWLKKVKENDKVILAGDFSWATYIEESKADFDYLNELPGEKYLLKGNHDYWWTTLKKMDEFVIQNGYSKIHFIYNNVYDLGEYVLAGTRYWAYDENVTDNDKIFNREIIRAKLSLEKAKVIAENENKKIIFVTHYPPDDKIINALSNYDIKIWLYGHIHTKYDENIVTLPQIETFLTSCDYLSFKLKEIK